MCFLKIGGYHFLFEAIGKTMPEGTAAQLFMDSTDFCNFL